MQRARGSYCIAPLRRFRSLAPPTNPASSKRQLTATMAGVASCWLPAPVSGCPRHCPTCTGLPRAPRPFRAPHLRPPASSSNGAGPVLNGGSSAATEQRPSPPARSWPAPPPPGVAENPPPAGDTAEEGGWLEQAAARIADANGGNLYATGSPAADAHPHMASQEGPPADVTNPSSTDPAAADAAPRADDLSQRDAAAATLTGTGLQSGSAPASEVEAARAGGQVTDAPQVCFWVTDIWSRISTDLSRYPEGPSSLSLDWFRGSLNTSRVSSEGTKNLPPCRSPTVSRSVLTCSGPSNDRAFAQSDSVPGGFVSYIPQDWHHVKQSRLSAPSQVSTGGEVQPWGRTVAQALAAGEQTRRRHDEASAALG